MLFSIGSSVGGPMVICTCCALLGLSGELGDDLTINRSRQTPDRMRNLAIMYALAGVRVQQRAARCGQAMVTDPLRE